MRKTIVTIALTALLALTGSAQEGAADNCGADVLAQQQSTFAAYLTLDFAADAELALANLFRLGVLYQSLALDCGYQPNAVEIDRLLEQTLAFVSLDDLILAQAVGTNVEAILLELDEVYRRSAKGPTALQRIGAGAGRQRAGLRRLPRERGGGAPDRGYLDTNRRDSTGLARLLRLQPSPIPGREHCQTDGLYHARLRRHDAGDLRPTADGAAASGFGGLSRQSGSAAGGRVETIHPPTDALPIRRLDLL